MKRGTDLLDQRLVYTGEVAHIVYSVKFAMESIFVMCSLIASDITTNAKGKGWGVNNCNLNHPQGVQKTENPFQTEMMGV